MRLKLPLIQISLHVTIGEQRPDDEADDGPTVVNGYLERSGDEPTSGLGFVPPYLNQENTDDRHR